MVSETELRAWRKSRSQSRKALWPAATFGLTGTLVLVVLFCLAEDRGPGWGWWLALLGSVWFGFVGDWINVRCLTRRIARAEQERGAA